MTELRQDNTMKIVHRCPFSYYDRVAYCQVCEITGRSCDGYVEDCEHRIPEYGDED